MAVKTDENPFAQTLTIVKLEKMAKKHFFKLTEMAVAARYFKANLFTLKLMTMNEREGRLRSLKTPTI